MSQGSNRSEGESIEEENEFAGLNISQLQAKLGQDVQELNREIGACVSTDPQDPATAQLPP